MDKRFTCRKAAVFSDIHSNYHAFKACYEDAVSRGADLFIFLGDYVSDLADPQKTLDLVYEIREKHPTVSLRGNRERYMLECKNGITSFTPGSKTGSLFYTYDQLRPQDFEFIESLPIYDQIELNGIPFEIAHAAKEDDRYYFERTDERMKTVFDQMKFNYFLGGHSHRQYVQHNGERTICNPGSIGVPREHGALTQYAIMEFCDKAAYFALRQIPYDVKAMIHRQFESGLVDIAPHWAISILYDVMTGKEYVEKLLDRVCQAANGNEAAVRNEQLWHRFATQMGMKFTEKEILDLYTVGSNTKFAAPKVK